MENIFLERIASIVFPVSPIIVGMLMKRNMRIRNFCFPRKHASREWVDAMLFDKWNDG